MERAAEKGKHLRLRRFLSENIQGCSGQRSKALALAASNGHLRCVSMLLDAKADVNFEIDVKVDINKTRDTRTPIMCAASGGYTDVVNALIEARADLNKLSRAGWSVLHSACRRPEYSPIVAALLAAGALVDAPGVQISPLCHATRSNSIESMKLLIAAGIDVDGMAYEQSPLSYAALNCSIDAMKLLLDAKADVNSPGHSATRSPLAGALDVMHLEGVKLLIAAGADVTVRDSQNLTLLHRLVSSCLPKGTWTRIGLHDELIPLYAEHLKATPCDPEGVLQALVDAKADISARGPEGITPLQLATVKNNIQAVSALLVAGADPNDAADDGTTALIMAAREGCLGPVAPLLAFGADVNQTDDDGCTALISAVINNCHEIAATLLRSGADVNHFWDDSTALDFWEDGEEDEEMLCLLEDAGALTWDEVVVENNSLLRFSEDGDFLGFEYELVASASEHDKEVALNYAVENDNLSIVKCLLAAGVSPSIRVCSDSLLCMASADGYIDIVRELLDAGADITEKDDEGLTALQVAAKEKHRDVVALLLAHANKLKKANK